MQGYVGCKVPVAGRKQRRCLKCGKMFESTGPANRRCPSCDQEVGHAYVRGTTAARPARVMRNYAK